MIEALGDPRFYVVFWLVILLWVELRWRQHLGNQRAMIFHLEFISRWLARMPHEK